MRKGFAVVLIFAVFVISGCAEPRGWRFTPNTYTQPPKPLLLKSVVVPPFKDSRPNENSDKIALYLIPIMPFGWANLSAPESWSPFFKYRPTEDFARAAAEELRATGLFKEAFFAERTSEGDLILRGEIKSTHYNQKNYFIWPVNLCWDLIPHWITVRDGFQRSRREALVRGSSL